MIGGMTVSRSVRKKPYRKAKSHFSQKMAARRCRRLKLILPDGCKYKRYYPQWDVIDYRWGGSFRECLNNGWYTSLTPTNIDRQSVKRLTFIPSNDGEIIVEEYSYADAEIIKHIGTHRYKAEMVSREITYKSFDDISFKTATEEELRHYYIKWKKEVLCK